MGKTAYLAKLSPTVGNGLGGLPYRKNSGYDTGIGTVDTRMIGLSIREVSGYVGSSGVYSLPTFNHDGTKVLYIRGNLESRILTTSYDMTTMEVGLADRITANISCGTTVLTFSFSSDGTKLLVVDFKTIKLFTLTVAHDLSTLVAGATKVLPTSYAAYYFSLDGTKLYRGGTNLINVIDIPTAYDPSSIVDTTGTDTTLTYAPTTMYSIYALFVSEDESFAYFSGSSGITQRRDFTISGDFTSDIDQDISFSLTNGSSSNIDLSISNDGINSYISYATQSLQPLSVWKYKNTLMK